MNDKTCPGDLPTVFDPELLKCVEAENATCNN